MAGIDKAAIVFSMAIALIGVGIAVAGNSIDYSPSVSTPTVSTEMVKPTTQADPFADIANKVKEGAPTKTLKSGWERATSETDPGVGHETHQLAVLLAPSDKVYSGTLNYDASENIQLVVLHGPLAVGEDAGQATWTPDGKTKFALTFVDPKNSKGKWEFAGNALAVHTMNTEPFTVDYKVDYTEKQMSDTVVTGTTTSVQDPGLGHESHQIAVLLAPSSDVYSGILSYSASENIQLVSLRGPISADEKPAATWTPDGETIFELTFVDPNNTMGSWEFSGNALAVHTKNTNQFTVSYSVSATATAGKTMELEEEISMEETHEKTHDETMMKKPAGPTTHNVDMPAGTSTPGCESNNTCFIPADITINAGDTVNWINVDTAAHTVTSGSPSDGPSGVFDSSLVMGGASYAFTFNDKGSFDYFCMVHPWMTGSVTVN
ncbi:plastocyanin/azurin family copper-binding protein [Nitrosopumilus sp.]|uniref:cupredoxin domain-containing protein n=1 Tax=Nitrosopumilus sp. TaxID=2024843 RepID=UPI0034A07A3A